MRNVQEVTDCFQCKAPGALERDYGYVMVYKCPKCGQTWTTIKVKPKRERR